MFESKVLKGKAKPLGAYPHLKRAGDFLFVSGTSCRCVDNSFTGVEIIDEAGNVKLDIKQQTRAVIENIKDILASADAGLEDLTEITTFLVDIEDFAGYNDVYAEYFDSKGPARTTIAVRQLPLPFLLVEMKAIAYKPVMENKR